MTELGLAHVAIERLRRAAPVVALPPLPTPIRGRLLRRAKGLARRNRCSGQPARDVDGVHDVRTFELFARREVPLARDWLVATARADRRCVRVHSGNSRPHRAWSAASARPFGARLVRDTTYRAKVCRFAHSSRQAARSTKFETPSEGLGVRRLAPAALLS